MACRGMSTGTLRSAVSAAVARSATAAAPGAGASAGLPWWAAAAAVSGSRCASSAAAATGAGDVAQELLKAAGVSRGDVVVQNEADSEVGRAVIALARGIGATTVNIIADKPGSADTVETLKLAGADVVVTESYTNTWFVRRLLSDLPAPKAGLSAATGTGAVAVARLLGSGGTLLTYGAGKQLPPTVPYKGAERRPKPWADYLREKGLTAKSL